MAWSNTGSSTTDVSDLLDRRHGKTGLNMLVNRPPSGRLNHFHARFSPRRYGAGTIHRVYLTDDEMWFIDIGVTTLNSQLKSQQVAMQFGGGLFPALAGKVAAQKNEHEVQRWTKALDGIDEKRLREFVASDSMCFSINAKEVCEVRLDPRGFWDLLTRGSDCKAILRMNHVNRGKMALELLTINDVSLCLAEIPRLIPSAQINVNWKSL